jgi:hypothetical protein
MSKSQGTKLVVGDDIKQAYNEIRQKNSSENWILFKYQDNNTLSLAGKGSGGLAELVNHFEDGERLYAYLKVKWGDDLSTREKFVLITWVGERVPPLKKARVSTDKAFVKEVVKEFAIEVFVTRREELNEEEILKKVKLVSGADYGEGN